MSAPCHPCLHCDLMAAVDRWLASDVSDEAQLRSTINVAASRGLVMADVLMREPDKEKRFEAVLIARAVMMSKIQAELSKDAPSVQPTHRPHGGWQ